MLLIFQKIFDAYLIIDWQNQKYLKNQQKEHPKMTAESLIGYFESRGHPYGRHSLFDEKLAKKVLVQEHKLYPKAILKIF